MITWDKYSWNLYNKSLYNIIICKQYVYKHYYNSIYWYNKSFIFNVLSTMAHKKAQSSTQNFRDSKPKYRWVKLFWWQIAVSWNIIVRQQWNKMEAWDNVFMGRDFTLHAKIDGMISFSKKRIKKFDGRTFLKTFVHVIPHTTVA